MSSLGAGNFVTRLSSAGLVYAHYGRRVIAELLEYDGSKVKEKELNELFNKVYESFVEEVDGVDNGVPVCSHKDCVQRLVQ